MPFVVTTCAFNDRKQTGTTIENISANVSAACFMYNVTHYGMVKAACVTEWDNWTKKWIFSIALSLCYINCYTYFFCKHVLL